MEKREQKGSLMKKRGVEGWGKRNGGISPLAKTKKGCRKDHKPKPLKTKKKS